MGEEGREALRAISLSSIRPPPSARIGSAMAPEALILINEDE